MDRCRMLTMVVSLVTAIAACTDAPPPSFDSTSSAPSPSTDGVDITASAELPEAPSAVLYEPPVPLPQEPIGTLVRSEPIRAPAGVKAWAVLYLSTGSTAAQTAVSGIILIPDGPVAADGRPILAWAHGTTGLADPCAPSHVGDGGDLMYVAQPFLEAGYVVAATDYEGLGTPGPHPYIDGPSEGRSVLDAIRAARLLPEAEAGSRVAVLGHSQGGHAALWAAELAPAYAPELDMTGVVAAAPAGDLAAIASWISGPESGPTAWLNAVSVLSAWHEIYGLPLDDVLRPAERQRATDLQTQCPSDSLAPQEQPLAADPSRIPGWREHLLANTPGTTPAVAPILVLQGAIDEQIPLDSTRSLVDRLCAAGDSVDLRIYRGVDHVGALDQERLRGAAGWIAERSSGPPTANSCAA